MTKNFIAPAHKVNGLSSTIHECFCKIVGQTSNHGRHDVRIYSPDESLFMLNSIVAMVNNFLQDVSAEEIEQREKQRTLKNLKEFKINTSLINYEQELLSPGTLNIIPVGEFMLICPRCGNEEFESHHNFCKVCGLPKSALIGGERDEKPF